MTNKFTYDYDGEGLTLTDTETGSTRFLRGDEADSLYGDLESLSDESIIDVVISDYFDLIKEEQV